MRISDLATAAHGDLSLRTSMIGDRENKKSVHPESGAKTPLSSTDYTSPHIGVRRESVPEHIRPVAVDRSIELMGNY
jgi:hypothetical protein